MKKDDKPKLDFFGDGMRIFLDYISRQSRKDPDYKSHPLIRAFECASQGIQNVKFEECTMGLAKDGTADAIYNPYIVVLQKKRNGVEVKEIRNVMVNKTIPLDVMITTFRLQIQLDKIKGDTVTPDEMVDALNAVIPGNKFFVLGDRWKEALHEFKRLLKEKKIYLPRDPKLLEELAHIDEELSNINNDTPWEEYSNQLRALIGGALAPSLSKEKGIVVITSPTDSQTEKYKVFDIAIEFMLGKTADYLRPSSPNNRSGQTL